VLSFLATPIALLMPLPLAIAVNELAGHHAVPGFLGAVLPSAATGSDTAVFALAACLFVVVSMLGRLQELGETVLATSTGEKLLLAFRARLFRHVQRLSLAFHDRRGTADSTYRIQYDAPSIQWIAVYGVTPFVTSAFMVAGMIYVTARLDAELALIALAVAPVLFVLTHVYRGRLRTRWSETKKLESSALGVVQEVLTGLRVVTAFGQEEREQDRFVTRSGEGTRARIRLAATEGAFTLLIGLVVAVGTAAVIFVGATHVRAGDLTVGAFVLVMGYLAQLYAPLSLMSKSLGTLQSSLASAERAFDLLDEVPDVRERPHASRLARARGAVDLRDVSFAYEPGRPVLHDLSLAVPPGTRVGISGTTGSGKTTLVSLLTRFYDPTGGAILLDGVDLRDYRLADLRNQFAIVLQEPLLFSTSIGENIRYARPDASDEAVAGAAAAAGAEAFVRLLPDGYETRVGERGMTLSGGERQRIALARAFLKDAPLLILDEPTSSVDVRTEAAIMGAMERLMEGRTTFIITHRLATLEHADLLLRVDAGRLVEAAAPAG
jgi:ATP-binding cassette subfamily B protein